MVRTAALLMLAISSPVLACAPLSGPRHVPAVVASEAALIVWNPETKTEEFIRTAAFENDGSPVGFLVPTPTPPKLLSLNDDGYYPDGLFSVLNEEVGPRVIKRRRPVYRLTEGWEFGLRDDMAMIGASLRGPSRAAPEGEPNGVSVLSRQRVGSYDTAVLKANDPAALLRWLKKNGFESNPRLTEWLRPYTRKGWAITAFRFVPKGAKFASEPVRLSFKTDRPFYPYREPGGTDVHGERSLRVFLLAPDRFSGQLEDRPWPTKAEFSDNPPLRPLMEVARVIGLQENEFDALRLTSFLDKTVVRPDSELYFDRDPDQKPVEPPPVYRDVDEVVYLPKGLVTAGLGMPLLLSLRVARRRRNSFLHRP